MSTSTRHYERGRPFAVEHLALDVTLEVDAKRIRATATVDARRIDPSADELVLDAVGFEVDGVTVDGKSHPWRYDGRSLFVSIPPSKGKARVAIAYRAAPRRGLYFLQPDEHYPHRPRQVWSQCQEEDARHFVPCDDSPGVKMTTEVIMHVPNGWYALSNGALVSSTKPRTGDFSYHWKMTEPLASYLLTIVAGEFAEVTDTSKVGDRMVPLSYLVPKDREGDVQRTFGRTSEMMRHFSQMTGVPYPWNKYAQVVVSDFIFGGMENTTATTLHEHVILDERASLDISSDDLIAHELAHQWFGDYVTCRTWYEAWLNEGFATFFELVWREKALGRDEYEYVLRADLASYLSEAHGRYRRPIVCQDYDAPLDLFDRHLYEKGALVLHALRIELGDDLFWAGVRAYITTHAGGIVETRDLQRAMEGVSGRGLGRFFEQWIHKPGHPEIEVSLGWEKGVLTVGTRQMQSTADGVPGCFELFVDLDIADAEGRVVRRTVHVVEKQQTFVLSIPDRPVFAVVDPGARILGEVRLKAPADMLREQLARAPTARGRWLAAQALSKSDDPATLRSLGTTLNDEGAFWGTRAECAAALGKLRASEGFDALKAGLSTTHPKVRRAIVEALGQFKTPQAVLAIRPHALRDPSYVVEAEAARALGRTRQTGVFDELVDMLDRPSWFDVVRAGAIDGLAALRDDRAVPHLMARIRYGHPARARRAAVLSLPKVASDRVARETLEQLLDDPDPLLRQDVARALGELGDAKARGALRERLEVDLDSRVRRRIREVLRDLTEPKRNTDQLRDELEKLQGDHAELKARMAKLEAFMSPRSDGREKRLPKKGHGRKKK